MKLSNSLTVKIITIVVLTLLLLIPTTMIKNLIRERQSRAIQSQKEINNKWANSQTIVGPILTIPYYKDKISKVDGKEKIEKVVDYLYILPEKLNINSNILPTIRYRGIFESVLYESNLDISGKFEKLPLEELGISEFDLQLDKALINLNIDDLRGIENLGKFRVDDKSYHFNPGISQGIKLESGVSTYIELTCDQLDGFNFALNFKIKGSENLSFIPIGKTTDVYVQSSWETPSFIGSFLPDSRKIDKDGFEANWNILHLNRNFPQFWVDKQYQISDSQFGVNLNLPVDNYQRSMRSAKYAILFVGLTFLIFFFIEVLNNKMLHPIQYLLVGTALVIFYTLLLSISEHLRFDLAYIISSSMTISLIGFYLKSILSSLKLSMFISLVLTILYTFLYTIIQLEGYSLIVGSVGLFIVLSIIMIVSRNIDWNSISFNSLNKN